jgi:hypothetical protein
MHAGWAKWALLLALGGAMLAPCAARPDDASDKYNGESVSLPQPADLGRSHRATPRGWPLELKLPESGTLHLRGDHDWSSETLDFLWEDHEVGSGSGDIFRIDGTFQPLDFDPLSVKYQPPDHLYDYCWSWLSDTLHARILSSRKGIEIAGRRWQEFRVEEPVKPHLAGDKVKTGLPPLKYYLYASPMRDGMLLLHFYYDDPPRPDRPHKIALMLRYD